MLVTAQSVVQSTIFLDSLFIDELKIWIWWFLKNVSRESILDTVTDLLLGKLYFCFC